MKKNLLMLPMLLLIGVAMIQAQVTTPAPSPSCKIIQTVGLSEITVEYSRPSMKDRMIFAADGLVPFGKTWRTGANAVTKVTFSDDVAVEGHNLTAGSYALTTMPGAKNWVVNFYPYDKSNWNSYGEATPAASFSVESMEIPAQIETFMINFDRLKNDGATMELLWASTYVPIDIKVDSETKVMASIDRALSGPSDNDYFRAASYYLSEGKDMNKALQWINKATSGENKRFWMVRTKSLILAEMGKKKQAIEAAKLSLELAEKAGNDDYIKMNKDSIKKWMM